MTRRGAAWAMLTLLTLGGLLSVYQLLFSVWMTAYPHVDTDAWHTRFYERLAITIVIGFFWSILAVWLFRHRRRVAG
jgi:hypothetical protein